MAKFDLSRRQFLWGLGSSYWALHLAGCASVPATQRVSTPSPPREFGPIDRSLGEIASPDFFGDIPKRAHDIFLRSLASRWTSSVRPEVESAPVVILGAGVAGLVAAYELKDLNPVVLEQAERVGGNSQGQSWHGIDYALGAAYFSDPQPGTPLHRLLIEDLKIDDIAPIKRVVEPVWLREKIVSAPAYGKLKRLSEDFLKGKRPYPNLPEREGNARLALNKMDRLSLKDFLVKEVGELPADMALYLEKFCHSAFAARPEEISAAAGINFLVAEDSGIRTANGGNGAVLERIYQKLIASCGPQSVRCNSLVTSVEVKDKQVHVTYVSSEGVERRIVAKAVVVALPKFIARRLIKGLEPDRVKAIHRLRYRSYLVANLLLRKDVNQKFFDMYLLSNSEASDVVNADFTKPVSGYSVLTFYRPFPAEGARVRLLEDGAYEKYRLEFESLFLSSLGKELGFQKEDIADLRLARWGHPVVLSQKGFLRERLPERISAPFAERVFFAQQDNWCLPCFETAASEAIHHAGLLRKLL